MKVLQYKKYAWAIGGFSNNILDMDKRVYLVYMHVSPSGKAYIGRTKNYVHRSYRHQHEASCPVFKTAIDKYGWNRFTHSILAEGLTIKEANYMENLCILAYNTILPGGYNMTLGGQNPGLSEAARESIGAAHKGRKRSAITRARISAALTGRQLSPTHIANLSAAKKGHPCSAARKAALSKTNTGRKHTAEAKKTDVRGHKASTEEPGRNYQNSRNRGSKKRDHYFRRNTSQNFCFFTHTRSQGKNAARLGD